MASPIWLKFAIPLFSAEREGHPARTVVARGRGIRIPGHAAICSAFGITRVPVASKWKYSLKIALVVLGEICWAG